MKKICPKCKINELMGKYGYCRPCTKEYDREAYRKNRDKILKAKKEKYVPSNKPRYTDHAGKKYGDWSIVSFVETKNNVTYWLAKCSCGTEKVVNVNTIVSGSSKSCGCKKLLHVKEKMIENGFWNYDEGTNFNNLLRLYKHNAKRRGIEFLLTDAEFKNLTKNRCYYCDVEAKQQFIGNKGSPIPYIYNGVDRKNNELGYILENCVSCCSQCNYSKNDLSLEDFDNWIDRVYKHKLSRQ